MKYKREDLDIKEILSPNFILERIKLSFKILISSKNLIEEEIEWLQLNIISGIEKIRMADKPSIVIRGIVDNVSSLPSTALPGESYLIEGDIYSFNGFKWMCIGNIYLNNSNNPIYKFELDEEPLNDFIKEMKKFENLIIVKRILVEIEV